MSTKNLWAAIKQTFTSFSKDNVMRLSAALAYYAIFSLGPMLFIILVLAGVIFGEETVRQFLHSQISSMVGENAGKTIDSMMAARKFSGSMITTIIGIVTLVFGALGVFGELQDSLNTIWHVQAKPDAGWWMLIRKRLLSLSMILGIFFLLMISMILTTAVEAGATSGLGLFSLPKAVVAGLTALISFVIVAVFFSLAFKYLPDVKVNWRPVLMGSIFAAVLFTGGKYLLSLYLAKQATSSSYGAAGSVVAILLWVYYASLIMFIGAEFSKAYADCTGAKGRPDEHAMSTDRDDRDWQGAGPKPEGEEEEEPEHAHREDR
jgi:membrane protein